VSFKGVISNLTYTLNIENAIYFS